MVKLKGSSLLENIVAMVILMIVMAILIQTIMIVGGAVKLETKLFHQNELRNRNIVLVKGDSSTIESKFEDYRWDKHFFVRTSYFNNSDGGHLDSLKQLYYKQK